jgi:isoquinoline 1-oxidoreductase alpha subunit
MKSAYNVSKERIFREKRRLGRIFIVMKTFARSCRLGRPARAIPTDAMEGTHMAVAFTINGKAESVDVDANTPLLWVVREHLKLTGTKFGCGSGLCGACTVHVDGKALRSCQTTMSEVSGKKITTIEGLSPTSSHPLQKAWVAEQVPQCGYCQSGQIMQAAELLAKTKKPSRDQIVKHMDGNICRCGTYPRIVKAIQRAAKEA